MMSSPDSTTMEVSTTMDAYNICFSCRGTQFESYLKSGFFKNFTDCQLKNSKDNNIELFGKLFPAKSCMWINMEQLFIEIKKNIFVVKAIALNNIRSLDNESNFITVRSIRMDIIKVLQFFIANLQELSLKCTSFTLISHSVSMENNNLKNMLVQLVKEIKHLLVFVGRISNIPGIVNIKDFSNDTSKSALNFYYYYHLCLDIWYNSLSILYNVSFMIPMNFEIIYVFCEDFVDQPSPFLQLSSFLIYEFSSLAINRYKHASMYGNSPFLCACMKDFWFMLIYLIDKSGSFCQGISFWAIYECVVQILVKKFSSVSMVEDLAVDTFSIDNIPLHKQNPIEACLWLMSHIAPLYKYNTLGNFCEYKQATNGYPIGKYLVINLLSNPAEAGEKSLRNVLSYCLQMVKLWPSSGDMLLPLTDFFIKKIDGTFNIQDNELRGLTYLLKSSSAWFTYITNLSDPNLLGNDSSFDRFLRVLRLQLEQDADSNLWRSLKGRVYSKFIPKKVKEICENGLQNSFSLFLIIAASGQFEIVSKICEIVSVIETTTYPRKQISWKALFVLLFICQKKNHDRQNIMTLITKVFNSACSDYSNINKDSVYKTKIMDLLLIYIDNMNEVFKRCSGVDLSECQLITAGFSELFLSCGITEMNYILATFHTILQRILSFAVSDNMDYISNEAYCIGIVQAVFSHIYPFVESIAITDTPPQVVAEIAATLTKLTYYFSSCCINCPYELHKMFMYFGSKENINCTISCRYLCIILDCPDLMNELKFNLSDLNTVILQSWLKCMIYIQTKSEYMQELTRKVLQSNIVDFIPGINAFDCDDDNHANTCINFYRLIGDSFKYCTQQQKTQMALKVQQTFKIFSSYVLSKIKISKDVLSFTHVYKLIAFLVEYCSEVLHLRVTSDHVLIQLLDKTVYPQIIFPKETSLQSLVSFSIREYLPNIIRGLFKLDYRKDESVKREIRNISMYYINIFSLSKHPLIKLAEDSVTGKPKGLAPDAYKFMLEELKSSLIDNKVEEPRNIFKFYQEIFKLTPPTSKGEITNVLFKCAMELVMKQKETHYYRAVMESILDDFKKMPLSNAKDILNPIIKWFIMEKLQWAVERGFSILNIFVECLPQVMSDSVPCLIQTVEKLEKNRGHGEDIKLRNGVRCISTRLQEKLNEK